MKNFYTFLKNNSFLLFHFFLVFFVYFYLIKFGIFHFFPTNSNLCNWDAGFYIDLANSGYKYFENKASNLAFFPMFPFLWRLLNLSYVGISVFNLLVFTFSVIIIKKTFEFDYKKMLVYISMPGVIFCFLPFSESMFFFFSVIFLYGYYKEKKIFIILGLFLASITRSVAPIFLVAIVFAELITIKNLKVEIINKTKNIAFYSFAVVFGIFVVAIIQYCYTGKWFYFFEVQKYWDKYFDIPRFPILTSGNQRIFWLDWSALIIGIMSTFFILKFFIKWVTNKLIFDSRLKPMIFSIVYLSMVSIITLFTSHNQGGTSIHSLNRYVFAVPFVIFFFEYIYSLKLTKISHIINIITLLLLLVMFYSHYKNINYILIYIYLIIFYLYNNKKIFAKYWFIVYNINILLQLILLKWFISGLWIG